MARTVDLSVSVRTRQHLVVGVLTGWVTLPLIAVVLRADIPVVPGVLAVLVGWLTLVVLWVRRLGGTGDGTTWDAIPTWQYDGRFAGIGGLTRGEQEETLGDGDDE